MGDRHFLRLIEQALLLSSRYFAVNPSPSLPVEVGGCRLLWWSLRGGGGEERRFLGIGGLRNAPLKVTRKMKTPKRHLVVKNLVGSVERMWPPCT